jgi:single-strand DNA-binding protein
VVNLNKIFFAGYLASDPEHYRHDSGWEVANFRLASNRFWKDQAGQKQSQVCFIDVKAFGRHVKPVLSYFKKGRPIMVEGHLQLETWEQTSKNEAGAEIVSKRSKHVIVLEQFQFVAPQFDGEKSDALALPVPEQVLASAPALPVAPASSSLNQPMTSATTSSPMPAATSPAKPALVPVAV